MFFITLDNILRGGVIYLILGDVRLQHFVKHVEFALQKYILQWYQNEMSESYRYGDTLVIWSRRKLDDKFWSGLLLCVIERTESADDPDGILFGVPFLGQILILVITHLDLILSLMTARLSTWLALGLYYFASSLQNV